jgi:hypothetical protein
MLTKIDMRLVNRIQLAAWQVEMENGSPQGFIAGLSGYAEIRIEEACHLFPMACIRDRGECVR